MVELHRSADNKAALFAASFEPQPVLRHQVIVMDRRIRFWALLSSAVHR
jgi:hypothetical protein